MASGTSFADLLHQAVDSAAHATGFAASDETTNIYHHGDTAQIDQNAAANGDDATTPDGTDNRKNKRHSTEQDSGATEYHAAPGNHPDDPRAHINHPAAANSSDTSDTNKEHTAAGHHASGHTSSKTVEPQTSSSSTHAHKNLTTNGHEQAKNDMGQSQIERALGDDGPVAQRQGSKLDRQLENELDGCYVDAEKQTKAATAAAELGQPVHTEHNQPRKSKDSSKDHLDPRAHQEHSGTRGPSWASRPDDAQRAKIQKMKEEQANGTWKRRFSSFSPGGGNDDKDASQRRSNEEKSPAGMLGGLFEGNSPARPGLNIFGSAGSQRVRRSQSTVNARSESQQKLDKGKQREDTPTQINSRTSSKWAENRNKLRNAFEPPTPSGESGPLSLDHNDDANDDSIPTPELAPDAQKLRAITKIMLGGPRAKDDVATPEGEAPSPTTVRTSTGGNGNVGQTRWAQLKKKVRESQRTKREDKKTSATGLDLAKELQTGVLPVFLLKMAIERDESKHRRIPVLLNHLRLRVTDSVNPMHNTHAVFRIELEYGDGLVKWVIYRELRDFINLHAHYRAAALRGYLGRSIGNAEGDVGLPSFPKMSLPYFNQLQRQGKTSRAEFAKAQRDALENYIIELIRRTMFRAEANRLCKFFEISALSVSLASRGGHQGKQGYLRILSRSSRKKDQKNILTPARWAKAYEPKWFIVRESFIAIVNEPDSLQLYDVFLMDNEFRIQRPKRLYKQTMHLAHGLTHSDDKEPPIDSSEQSEDIGKERMQANYDQTALLTDGHFKDADPEKRKTTADGADRHASSHTFYIRNAERKMKLVAKNERMMEQFIVSMQKMANRNIFGGTNRFESFAPIRLNASAQWLVDGRDYYWNLSKALMMAKDRIFIHDWWLSPELYLRRPGHPKWRLDNILKKKAEEGVKIFVIIYNEVSNNFTPTDSNYTKQRLIGLHRNIFVQRSPSHFQTGTFYWAHHEKLCVIDETIAFMGGLDLCFGRYDTPAHVLVDDAFYHQREDESDREFGITSSQPGFIGPIRDGREAHIWPGQDYANERVMEWHTLSKPAEDLFPRDKFPRMPWHDVGLQLVGQPSRDLCRHFIQRWNFLLRIKNHSRQMPFLVPPPDFTPEELQKYGLTGTCEVQICRSAGPWSLGTSSKVEHSIQNAYLKSIQMSDHFVYIENQFFVTSTVVEGNKIENKIGEALVSRIIRAHREGTPWRAIVVIPLIPGFPMPIDHPDASSVRLIVELQNRSIARGEHSIFGKLRREGIDPEQYISFFSLRTWGKLRGGQLTTEQIYLHDKIMIVDDRLAIIGSANINERSQRGDRDSELACVIRDHDMIDGYMAGKPYKVGRFAHTMRVRLMREHLGVDVDELEANERRRDSQAHQSTSGHGHSGSTGDVSTGSRSSIDLADEDQEWDPDNEQSHGGQPNIDGNKTPSTNFVDVPSTRQTVRDGTSNLTDQLGNGTGAELRRQVKDHLQKEGDKFKSKTRSKSSKSNGSHPMSHDAPDASTNASEKYVAAREERVERAINGEETNKFPDGKYDSALEPTLEEKVIVDEARSTTNSANGNAHSIGGAEMRKSRSGHLQASSELGRLGASGSMASLIGTGHDRESTLLRHSGSRGRFLSEDSTMAYEEDLRAKISSRMSGNPWKLPAMSLEIDPFRFDDPIDDSFYHDYWLTCAVHNTQIFRKVFKCVPDDTATTWAEYKSFCAWADRLARSGKFGAKESKEQRDAQAHSVPGASVGGPEGQVDPASLAASISDKHGGSAGGDKKHQQNGKADDSASSKDAQIPSALRDANAGAGQGGKNAIPTEGFSGTELSQMEALLEECRGSLVLHPTRFLEAEDQSNNFLFAMDRINPLLIYD